MKSISIFAGFIAGFSMAAGLICFGFWGDLTKVQAQPIIQPIAICHHCVEPRTQIQVIAVHIEELGTQVEYFYSQGFNRATSRCYDTKENGVVCDLLAIREF